VRDARLLIDTLRLSTPADVGALAAAWAGADARGIVALAQFEGASLWLQRRLKALGITLSGEAGETLAAAAKRATAYSLRMESETVATLAILDAAGIAAVVFGPGGAGLHSTEEYVLLDDVERCCAALMELAHTVTTQR